MHTPLEALHAMMSVCEKSSSGAHSAHHFEAADPAAQRCMSCTFGAGATCVATATGHSLADQMVNVRVDDELHLLFGLPWLPTHDSSCHINKSRR